MNVCQDRECGESVRQQKSASPVSARGLTLTLHIHVVFGSPEKTTSLSYRRESDCPRYDVLAGEQVGFQYGFMGAENLGIRWGLGA